jgi:hypothetical protein
VLELTDDIVIDAGALEACRRLHGLDYRLASHMSTLARCRAGGWRTCWEKRGDWDLETDAANQALFDPALMLATYADALRWAREQSRAQAS